MEKEQKNSRLSFRTHAAIIAAFALLSVVFTWPLAVNLNGIPGGDTFVFTHCFWWYKKALFSLQNPFLTNYIFYPEGVSLAFQSGTFGNFLLTLPVTLFAGPVAGVNVSYLLTFVLAAWFTFLLAYRLTRDLPSALTAAFLYSFSAMHTGHSVGHLNVSSIHCLPAVLYALYRAFEQRSWFWTTVAGVFFGMTILTDQLQSIMAAGATAAVCVWCLLNRRLLIMGIREILTRFALIALLALLIASPYLYAMTIFLRKGSAPLERGMFDSGGSNIYSADLFGFLLYPAKYGFFGKYLRVWFPGIMEPRPFLGVVVIALLLVLAFSRKTNPYVRKLWLAAAVPFVLSLGPTLHVGGRWQWWSDGSYIKLPYFYIAKLPLFAQIRTPDRFHIATSLFVALLVAFAMIQLRKFLAERLSLNSCRIIIGVVMILMVVEYLPSAGAAYSVPDSAYLNSVAKEPNKDPLLWLPLSRASSFARNGLESSVKAMYYQTIHEKPILNGLMSRVGSDQLDFKDPVLDAFVYAGNLDRMYSRGTTPVFEAGTLNQLCGDALLKRQLWGELRRRYGFRHIVVQEPFNKPGWATSHYIECLTGQSLVEEPSGGISYINLK